MQYVVLRAAQEHWQQNQWASSSSNRIQQTQILKRELPIIGLLNLRKGNIHQPRREPSSTTVCQVIPSYLFVYTQQGQPVLQQLLSGKRVFRNTHLNAPLKQAKRISNYEHSCESMHRRRRVRINHIDKQ
jgi:hypothetical protein